MVLVKNLKIFHLFIFGKISQQNVFDDILERKKAFLNSKIRKLKKSKNCDFSKGVSLWFGQKFGIFPCCYFWQNQPASSKSRRIKLVYQHVVSKAIMRMDSIVNNTAPEYLTSHFCLLLQVNYSVVITLERMNTCKLAVPQPRTEFYKRRISYCGSQVCYGTACLWRCGN